MRARRTDANHAQIVAAFRKMGWSVLDLSAVGKGCPDLAIGKHGRTVLVEIKDGEKSPSKRRLTPAECEFFSAWRGDAVLVQDIEDAMVINAGYRPPKTFP